jgi:hypothetical protein
MAGFENDVMYAIGDRLEPSTAQAIAVMQNASTDVSRINHTGNPESVVSANPSSLCHDPSNGTLYVKNSGIGNTGWVQLSPVVPVQNSKITTFLSSSTWTVDARSKEVEFYVWGGGGGGGSGRDGASGSAGGGGGGGGGQFVYVKTLASRLTSSPYTVTIGAGGTGGISINDTNVNGNPGSSGGNTSVVGVVIALGAGGGPGGVTGNAGGGIGVGAFIITGNTSSTIPNGGTGNATTGAAASNLTYASCTGGGGGAGYTAATARTGNAGGSIVDNVASVLVAGGLAGSNAGATAGNGNSPTTQALMLGGTGGGSGGNDGVNVAGTGGNGAQPGGGGGGGAGNLSLNASGAGGNGGDGQVVIIEYF